MTIKELKELLNRDESHDNDRLCVVVSTGAFPAIPCVNVKAISFGFDWDHGKAMFYPEKPLIPKPPIKKII